jgi:ABC-2 type transport system ATP-binding protein
MALIGKARLVIMDEPTGNLDLKSREMIWDVIMDVKKVQPKTTFIVSTQHIEEADYLSSRVCILKNGKIEAIDTPQKIRQQFGHTLRLKINRSESALSLFKQYYQIYSET